MSFSTLSMNYLNMIFRKDRDHENFTIEKIYNGGKLPVTTNLSSSTSTNVFHC